MAEAGDRARLFQWTGHDLAVGMGKQERMAELRRMADMFEKHMHTKRQWVPISIKFDAKLSAWLKKIGAIWAWGSYVMLEPQPSLQIGFTDAMEPDPTRRDPMRMKRVRQPLKTKISYQLDGAGRSVPVFDRTAHWTFGRWFHGPVFTFTQEAPDDVVPENRTLTLV